MRRLIADGLNVNITLLFAIEAHDRVIEAYLAGLEDRVAAGKPIDRLASVASFFVSRVDTEIDKRLDALAAAASARAARRASLALRGRAAIANAQARVPAVSQESLFGARWEALAARGRAPAAPAVGEHQHQESRVPRRDVRRGADRAATR